MAEVYLPFKFCFSQGRGLDKNIVECYNVVDRLFSNVDIDSTDASASVSFSDAYVGYTIISHQSIPMSWFWCDAIEDIVESYFHGVKNPKRYHALILLRQCLQKFLEDKSNSKHLMKVKEATSEAEVQAILAHHLFSKLTLLGEYIIDGRFAPGLTKCPACNEELNLGDTSIGNSSVWHGYPNILINKSTIKVDLEEDDTEETQEYEHDEVAEKKIKLDERKIGAVGENSGLSTNLNSTYIEVKTDKTALKHAFSQTITNAFYQVKQKPHLSSLCIPSFLASNVKAKILMYNCEQDRLYSSEDMYLFNDFCDHGLNVGTIVSIWLALHFEKFQNEVDEINLDDASLKKSSFQEKLSTKTLSVYKNQLYRPLPKKRNAPEQPLRTTLGPLVAQTSYTRSLFQRLENMESKYFK